MSKSWGYCLEKFELGNFNFAVASTLQLGDVKMYPVNFDLKECAKNVCLTQDVLNGSTIFLAWNPTEIET